MKKRVHVKLIPFVNVTFRTSSKDKVYANFINILSILLIPLNRIYQCE